MATKLKVTNTSVPTPKFSIKVSDRDMGVAFSPCGNTLVLAGHVKNTPKIVCLESSTGAIVAIAGLATSQRSTFGKHSRRLPIVSLVIGPRWGDVILELFNNKENKSYDFNIFNIISMHDTSISREHGMTDLIAPTPSPDGNFIAFATPAMDWYNVRTRKFEPHGLTFSGDCSSLAFNFNGRCLAIATETEVSIFDLDSKVKISGMRKVPAARCLAFVPDQKQIVVGCENGQAQLWDIESKKLLAEIAQSDAAAITVLPLNDGRVVSVHRSTNKLGKSRYLLRLWVWKTKKTFVVSLPTNVTAVAISAGQVAVGSELGRVTMWHLTSIFPDGFSKPNISAKAINARRFFDEL